MNVRAVQKCRGTSCRAKWRSTSKDLDLLTQTTLSTFCLNWHRFTSSRLFNWNKTKQANEFRNARLSAPVKGTLLRSIGHRQPNTEQTVPTYSLTPTPDFSICFTHHFTIIPHPSSGNFRSYSPHTLLHSSNTYPGAVSLKWTSETLLLSPVS